MRKYGLILLLLAAFAVLSALQTALLTQVGTCNLNWSYDSIVMDTDSTLCLYKYFTPSNATNYIEMKRIKANGDVEHTGTIYSFPYEPLGNDTQYWLHYTHRDGPTQHIIFSNNLRIVYLQITGATVVPYYLNFQAGGVGGMWGYPVFRGDKVYFIADSWENQTKLWSWNFASAELESVYDLASGSDACASPLGDDKILVSQWDLYTTIPQDYPAVIIDSNDNVIPTGYSNMLIKTFYAFEQNRYYVEWFVDQDANTYSNCGILSLTGDTIDLETWSSIDSWAEYGEGWRFLFPFGEDLHTCVYTYSGMSGDYSDARIYRQDAEGDIALVQGFPQISEPDKQYRFLGIYQGRMLAVHYAGGEDFFSLADPDTQEWINVLGSPWQGATEYYYSLKYLCSDRYIFVHGRSGVNNPTVYSCLKLEISTSSEDELQTGVPALSVYPNPTRGDFSIEFEQVAGQKAELELYNIRGQKVDTISVDDLRTGQQRINYQFNRRGEQRKAPGIYLLRLKQGNHQVTRKLVII